MAIRRRKVGNAVYLEEYRSFRVKGKVKTEFVRYLGREGEERAKPLPVKREIDSVQNGGSSRCGDVSLLWALSVDIGIPDILDRYCSRDSPDDAPTPGKLLTVWAINRVLHPESASMLPSWVEGTDLPRLTGIEPSAFTKDAFLNALDTVCGEDVHGRIVDRTELLDRELFERFREKYPVDGGETLAYDITTVLFFGVTCPLTELGYNPDGLDMRQVNVALLVTKKEGHPFFHSVYEGSRHSSMTVRNMLSRLPKNGGTLVWDRGMVSPSHVADATALGWNLICGLPKSLKSVRVLLNDTDVPQRPETLVRSSVHSTIYAVKAEAAVFGSTRSIAVYRNMEKAVRDADVRNEALRTIVEELDRLSADCSDWPEAKLHSKIRSIAGEWSDYIDVSVKRKGSGKRIEWSYRQHSLRAAERSDGKFAILSTDDTLNAAEIVNTYLEKDYIEKVFRHLKTDEHIEPVRHRLERRVRAYIFLLVLSYRIASTLHWKMSPVSQGNAWDAMDELLRKLSRVERVYISLGRENKVWYLNLLPDTKKDVAKLGFPGLFSENVKSKRV